MMTQTDRAIVVERTGKVIRIAGAGPQEQYQALRCYGISDIVAQAVAARLITIRLTA